MELAHAARAQQAKPKNKKTTPTQPSTPLDGVWPTRRFVLIWDELDSWWTHYDPGTLAAELTPEQVTAFLAVVTGSVAFADQLRAALETPDTDTADDGAADDGAGVRHLRAL